MGRVVFAAFKPKPGRENELLGVIADRLPLLRRLAMATDREPVLVRSRDGVIIEVSEWIDDDAIRRAHEHPEVHALWARFEACSTYVPFGSLDEAGEMFATFEAVAGAP